MEETEIEPTLEIRTKMKMKIYFSIHWVWWILNIDDVGAVGECHLI